MPQLHVQNHHYAEKQKIMIHLPAYYLLPRPPPPARLVWAQEFIDNMIKYTTRMIPAGQKLLDGIGHAVTSLLRSAVLVESRRQLDGVAAAVRRWGIITLVGTAIRFAARVGRSGARKLRVRVRLMFGR
jgi:hypothetical protein